MSKLKQLCEVEKIVAHFLGGKPEDNAKVLADPIKDYNPSDPLLKLIADLIKEEQRKQDKSVGLLSSAAPCGFRHPYEGPDPDDFPWF